MAITKTNKQKMDEIMGDLQQGVTDIFTSEKFADYLKTMSKFHNYSLNNTILIAAQKPNATRVAGFNKWKNTFKRNVKRGEKGIKILAPTIYKSKTTEKVLDPVTQAPMLDHQGQEMTKEVTVERPSFTVTHVFDVSQTEGEPLPSLSQNIYGKVENFQEIVSVIEKTSPVPVEYQPLKESMDGYFSPQEQKIVVDSGLSEKQMVLALVHEITHAKLHDSSKVVEQQHLPENERVKPKDRQTEEVEAESVAFAVCSYFGIETGENSFGYIASWGKNQEMETLKACLSTIKETASELISSISQGLMELAQEKTAEKVVTAEATVPEPPQPVVESVEQVPITTPEPPQPVVEAVEQVPIATPEPPAPEVKAVVQEPITTPEPPQTVVEAVEQVPLSTPEPTQPVVEAVEQAPITATEVLPDPKVTVEDCVKFGYSAMDELHPLGQEKAVELFQEELTVFLLNPDNTETMVFDVEEIQEHDGLFAVEKADWEDYAQKNQLEQENQVEQEQIVAKMPETPTPEVQTKQKPEPQPEPQPEKPPEQPEQGEKPPEKAETPPQQEETALPTVADYEEAVNQGQAISILGLAQAMQREKEVASKPKEKPSILAQLREAKQPSKPKQSQETAKDTQGKATKKEER